MDPIKEAFQRAKADIESLKRQIEALTSQVAELKSILNTSPTQSASDPTFNLQTPTQKLTEPLKQAPEALKTPFIAASTGNEGVPTNHQTNQPTIQHTGNEGVQIKTNFNPTAQPRAAHQKGTIDHLSHVAEILASLDGLKKEVRIKFKRLTNQEMVVFTKVYELDEAGLEVTYDLLAQSLKLTEISIRDYIRKIIAKGVPVEKHKENNKKILLSISSDLKRIASLQTIHQLREL